MVVVVALTGSSAQELRNTVARIESNEVRISLFIFVDLMVPENDSAQVTPVDGAKG